jgi:hypothetical protein
VAEGTTGGEAMSDELLREIEALRFKVPLDKLRDLDAQLASLVAQTEAKCHPGDLIKMNMYHHSSCPVMRGFKEPVVMGGDSPDLSFWRDMAICRCDFKLTAEIVHPDPGCN